MRSRFGGKIGNLQPSESRRQGSSTTSLCLRLLAVALPLRGLIMALEEASPRARSAHLYRAAFFFFPLTLFKSCSLITLQLKAIKEFSEQHQFQPCLQSMSSRDKPSLAGGGRAGGGWGGTGGAMGAVLPPAPADSLGQPR